MASNKDNEPRFGLYLPLRDASSCLKRAVRYSRVLKRNVRVLSFYIAWGNGTGPDLSGIEMVLEQGLTPMLTWEPWCLPKDPINGLSSIEQPDYSLEEILKGRFDDYIRQWAFALKNVSGPVLFRPMHEMNGNWYPWCGTVNGNNPEKFIETWRHLRSIFREAESEKLIWVWCPYAHSVPEKPNNEIWQYYPGKKEVDFLALDGYNWGYSRHWSTWQSFEEIFKEGYQILNRLSPDKPMMIAEAGCAEEGGDKGKWMEEAFGVLKNKFPRIRALVWFNTRKECDWRIESSKKSLRSFQRGLASWLS